MQLDYEPIIQEDSSLFSGQFLLSLIIGLLLLMPAAGTLLMTRVQPVIDTFELSGTDGNILRESGPVGMENYEQFFTDRATGDAAEYTFWLMVVRVSAVLIIPPLVGISASRTGRVGNRIVLSLVTVLLSPVALAILWSAFLGPLWGREPSPLYPLPDMFTLRSPEGARFSVALVDWAITLGIGLAAGVTAYMAAVRGRESGSSVGGAYTAVWFISIILAAGSALVIFDIPFVLTNGGPARATTTLMLEMYAQTFQRFRLGMGAVYSVIIMIGTAFFVFLLWWVTVIFRLRLAFVPRAKRAVSGGGCALPLLLLAALPVAGLVLWGLNTAYSTEASRRVEDISNLGNAFGNTVAPWAVIWGLQLPITYLAGLALGFVRPLGRVISNLIFLIFLVFAFMPDEVLSIAWFMDAREQGILNSPAALGIPWQIGGIALLVFKLFFDGAYERYNAARDLGESQSGAIISKVLIPSVGIFLLLGVVLSFMSVQSLFWPLIAVNSPDNFPLSVQLVMLRNQFVTDFETITVAALQVIVNMAVLFFPAFVLLHIFVLDRLALLAGKSEKAVVVGAPELAGVPLQTMGGMPTVIDSPVEPW